MEKRTFKRWNSKIVRLFWKQVGGESPLEAVERVCSELTDKLDKKTPPFQSEKYEFAELLNIRVVESKISCDGMLALAGTRFVIQVSESATPERKSFTVCHELGHAVMLRRATQDFTKIKSFMRSQEQPREEERLSNFFAANLLMPRQSFFKKAINLKPSTNSLFALASEYRTSVESTAHRIIELDAWKCHILWCTIDQFENKAVRILKFLKSDTLKCPFERKGRVNWGMASIDSACKGIAANQRLVVHRPQGKAESELWRLEAAQHAFKSESNVAIALICPEAV